MRFRSLLFCAFLVACGSSDADEKRSDLPPPACDPGTRPVVGAPACEPVGVATCAEGFRRASDAWGCEGVVPTSFCTGSERATLGSESCVVNDCDAAFPPAGADAVVGSQAELTSALSSVRAGGTIALREGTYEPITIDRSLSIVGQCAQKVRIRGTGQRGIYLTGGVKSEIRGVDVAGFQGGIVAAYGPDVSIVNVVLTGNTQALVAGEATVTVKDSVIDAGAAPSNNGVTAQLGSKVTLTGVEIRGAISAVSAFEDGTEITFRRSVIGYDGVARREKLIMAYGGSKIVFDETAIHTRAAGLLAAGKALPGTPVGTGTKAKASTIRFQNSEIRQIGFARETPFATADEGARVELEGTSVVHESYFAFMAGNAGSSFSMRGSSIRGGETDGEVRCAVYVTMGATAEVEDSAIVGARQLAMMVGHPGSTLSFTRSIVTGTLFVGPGPVAELGGSGIAIAVGRRGTLVLDHSAVVGSQQFGLMADTLGVADITSTVFDGTAAVGEEGTYGGDAIVVTGGAKLSLTSSLVRGSADAALMAIAGEGIVENTKFVGNRVGIHLTATRLRETATRPEAAEEQELVLVNSTFLETQSRVRTSEIELPGGPFR